MWVKCKPYTSKCKKKFEIFCISRDCNKKALKQAAEVKHELSACILIPTLAVLSACTLIPILAFTVYPARVRIKMQEKI